jgi:putative membrane protein
MIVRPRPSPFGLLFILRGSIIPMIASRVLTVVVVSIGVVALHAAAPRHLRDLSPTPFTLFGVAISIFLGFRNSACYERWWEGRRLWGQLIAETRVLAREMMNLLPEDAMLRRRCVHRSVAFAHALRDQLRGTEGDATAAWLPADEWGRVQPARSRPDGILRVQTDELGRLFRNGGLSDQLYRMLLDRLAVMTSIQTSCERLRSAPIPFTYTIMLHRTAWLFCLLVPFGLVGTLGYATPVVTAILAYAFFGLDALGEELEEPFSRSQNALPLDAMVRTIEIVTAEALGDKDVPEPLRATTFILH